MFFLRLLCEPLFAQRLRVILPPRICAFDFSTVDFSLARSVFATIQSVRSEIEQQLARSLPPRPVDFFGAPTCPGCSVRHRRSWDIALQRNLER
jgi:hypothetical protein